MANDARSWLSSRLGIVRLRQFADELRHRLSFVPLLYAIGAAVFVNATLFVDRQLSDRQVPDLLSTTVDSARTLFSAMAGGLITSITLLLSMMLVAVQLASSQFSPRTLRDWLGDRTLQHTIGIVLGTTMFCLLGLRATRGDDEGPGAVTIPNVTVLTAVVLGVVALIGVVRSVDHITHSLRVGSVTKRIADRTIAVIRSDGKARAGQSPRTVPALPVRDVDADSDTAGDFADIPASARAIEAPTAGWVQQIDNDTIIETLPEGSTGFVTIPLGAFVTERGPIMWVDPPPPDDDECLVNLLDAFALGDSRTLQQDVSFGLLQLSDIAVRALSPGVNDPSTANDVIVHLGNLLIEIWSQPLGESVSDDGPATLIRRSPAHREYLDHAFASIRRYAASDPHVLSTMIRSLVNVRTEVERRDLPGPIAPLDEFIAQFVSMGDRTTWTDRECREVDSLARGMSGAGQETPSTVM